MFHEGRKKFTFQRRNEGIRPEERRSAPQGKRDMSKVQCYQCYKFGHFRQDCLERSNDRKRGVNQHATTIDLDEPPKKPKNENLGNKEFFKHSYAVKGIGKTSIDLESCDNAHLSNSILLWIVRDYQPPLNISFFTKGKSSVQVCSPPLSDLKILIFFPFKFLASAFSSQNLSKTSSFVIMK